MAEAKRKPLENTESNVNLEGFDQIFDDQTESSEVVGDATTSGVVMADPYLQQQVEKLLERFSQLITLSVDQKVETQKIATQLIDNQRQLIATQQILIRLMDRSIELTRHISSIEEKLPALFELPRIVESLRQRVAQLEGVELD
ncbi:MAG TPA: hypothetical protein V6C72_19665 [Chroococcales cyanobacterium]